MVAPRRHTLLVLIAVATITAAALAVRAQHLRGPDGTLGEDETRLALAAEGILATGAPVMPSGKLYLRGVVNSYLTAASVAAFGPRDRSVRLPNVLVGALLAPLLFLFGREVSGTIGGLCLAMFGAVQPELIRWSAHAWMTSLFIVVFVGATYLCHLAFVRDRHRLQVPASLAVMFAVLAHEFGVLLVAAVFATVGIRTFTKDRGFHAGHSTTIAFITLVASTVLFLALGLFLRSGTVAGAGGEFTHYFGPSLDPRRFVRDANRWSGDYLPLAVLATIGCGLVARRRGKALLLFLVTGIIAASIWVVLGKSSTRYGLLLLPLIALAAAWSITELTTTFARWRRLDERGASWLASVALILLFGIAIRGDLQRAMVPATHPEVTWPTELAALGFRAGDAIVSDNPEIPAYYVGQVHYWLRMSNFERYTFRDGDRLRHVYTGATQVGEAGMFYRQLRASGATTAWFIGSGDSDDFPPGMEEWLTAAADPVRRTADGFLILRIDVGTLPPPG